MDTLIIWKACEEVTLFQAAMLSLGYDPQDISSQSLSRKKSQPQAYEATMAALKSAILSGKIQTNIIPYEDDFSHEAIANSVNPDLTMVNLQSVGQYLQSRGIDNPICSQPNPSQLPDYLNSAHPCYAPKLAAAINAWLAVTTDPKALNKKSPKEAIEKWLRLNAHTYGLTLQDGSPNNTGIEEICKVANWRLKGGATKTLGTDMPIVSNIQQQTHPPLKYLEDNETLDDDIPF